MRSFSLFIKRTIDIVLSVVVLVIVLPLFVLIPILVKISSPGPVLFIQKRMGRGMRSFDILKFRTMISTTKDQSKTWSKEEEARITSIGRLLRDYGLDELPQLCNILKGDMSIIGPRSLLPITLADLPMETQRKLTKMRPGVLCLSALYGRRSLQIHERIAYQVKYVDEWSLLLDFKIFWKSLFVVLMRKNVNEVVN